jgi:hypothetical protein
MGTSRGFLVSALVAVSLALCVSNGSAAEILTNETVVTMVKAGLGEELILSKVKASQGQYDLSTNGILKLKNDGVSERIIQAMLAASTVPTPGESKAPAATAAPPVPSSPGAPPAIVVHGQSLFVKPGDKVLEVLPVVAEVAHSMKKHFIPFYFGPGDNWHFIRGQKSVVRLPRGKPVFYTKVNPSSFQLMRLSYDAGKNIRYVVSTGAVYRDAIAITVNRLSDDSFALAPGTDLDGGEYAFVSGGTFYDFGVE